MSNADELAFPVVETFEDEAGQTRQRIVGGLTKREHLAGMIMQGLLSSPHGPMPEPSTERAMDVIERRKFIAARVALLMTDALLAELDKNKG